MMQARHSGSVHRMVLMSLCALAVLGASQGAAQRAYDRPPVVKEGTTVRISPHVYVIPDERARGVPNEDDRVLFSGDLAMKQVFPAFTSPQSRADKWIESLKSLEALRPSRVVGAHYDMGDASVIAAYREFFVALRARVAELKRQGISSDEAATTLRNEFRAKYPDWDQPLRVHGAAAAIYAELP